jgi:hypothetical protein
MRQGGLPYVYLKLQSDPTWFGFIRHLKAPTGPFLYPWFGLVRAANNPAASRTKGMQKKTLAEKGKRLKFQVYRQQCRCLTQRYARYVMKRLNIVYMDNRHPKIGSASSLGL